MAEYIEHNIEEMLPELEQTLRVGLLDAEQLQALLRRRRRLEYKIARRSKRPRDYQTYIRHEVRLLALMKQRRHELGYQFKREEIERSIVCRVQRLHRQLCNRFQSEPAHWLAAVRFLESVGFLDSAGKTLHRMLQVHLDRPELWALAGRWFWDACLMAKCDRITNDKARVALLAREAPAAASLGRDVLLRGLRRLPDAALLYRELTALEAALGTRLLAALSSQDAGTTDGASSAGQLLELPTSASELDWEAVRRGDSVRAVIDAALERWPADRELLQQLMRACAEHVHLTPLTEELQQQLDELPQLMDEEVAVAAPAPEEQVAAAPTTPDAALAAAAQEGGLTGARAWWKEAAAHRCADAALAAAAYVRLETAVAPRKPVNMARVRRAAELALSGFGQSGCSVALWLAYVRAEERHGEAARVAQLDWRARKFLRDEFLTEYSLRRLYPHLEQDAKTA